jgi:hypothetical protein
MPTSHPEDWVDALPTMEFTHNNRRHTDQLKTPFKLTLGSTPVAIPLSYENTKFPTVEEKMKTLTKDREEALVVHELARSCMIEQC